MTNEDDQRRARDSTEHRNRARAGEFDAVWWIWDGADSRRTGVHLVVDGDETILSPSQARAVADKLEQPNNGLPETFPTDDSERLSMVSDLRESAEALEYYQTIGRPPGR